MGGVVLVGHHQFVGLSSSACLVNKRPHNHFERFLASIPGPFKEKLKFLFKLDSR